MAMWQLTSDDLQVARNELTGRRAAIEAKHARELQGLDEELAEIEAVERVAAAFTLRRKAGEDEPAAEPAEPASETAAEQEPPPLLDEVTPPPVSVEPSIGSRWRRHFPDRMPEQEAV